MFEASDDLRLGFETADEVGVVGITGANSLDRDLTADHWLVSAIDKAESASADFI